jgi:hypothetical protein
MAQVLGLVLLAAGGWLLWSPWALVIAGMLLLLGPEVSELRRRQQPVNDVKVDQLRRGGQR